MGASTLTNFNFFQIEECNITMATIIGWHQPDFWFCAPTHSVDIQVPYLFLNYLNRGVKQHHRE
jgi:hypothetical protein